MTIFCAHDRHMANFRDFLKIMFNKDLIALVHITYSNCDTLLAAGGTHRELPASVVHRRAPRAIVFLIRGHCLDFPRRQCNYREYPQITRECKVRELSVRTVGAHVKEISGWSKLSNNLYTGSKIGQNWKLQIGYPCMWHNLAMWAITQLQEILVWLRY